MRFVIDSSRSSPSHFHSSKFHYSVTEDARCADVMPKVFNKSVSRKWEFVSFQLHEKQTSTYSSYCYCYCYCLPSVMKSINWRVKNSSIIRRFNLLLFSLGKLEVYYLIIIFKNQLILILSTYVLRDDTRYNPLCRSVGPSHLIFFCLFFFADFGLTAPAQMTSNDPKWPQIWPLPTRMRLG